GHDRKNEIPDTSGQNDWLTKIILPTLPLNSVVGQCPGFCLGSFTDQNVKQYVFISTLKTWGSAQSYCRTHYTDLATIDSEEENLEVIKIIPNDSNAWIGLYRVPWLWSDKTQNSFRNQGSADLNSGNQHCCDTERYFICENGEKIFFYVLPIIVPDLN
uniref:C-type lectin domain-containing protein n=1 Tax=Fundulus heteroclitus TaxID=8078 RepID=A0A3Q2PA66_FUNHE